MSSAFSARLWPLRSSRHAAPDSPHLILKRLECFFLHSTEYFNLVAFPGACFTVLLMKCYKNWFCFNLRFVPERLHSKTTRCKQKRVSKGSGWFLRGVLGCRLEVGACQAICTRTAGCTSPQCLPPRSLPPAPVLTVAPSACGRETVQCKDELELFSCKVSCLVFLSFKNYVSLSSHMLLYLPGIKIRAWDSLWGLGVVRERACCADCQPPSQDSLLEAPGWFICCVCFVHPFCSQDREGSPPSAFSWTSSCCS